MKIITLQTILGNKSYPEAGDDTFNILLKAIEANQKVVIDMQNVISLPSMFMNASFGAIIDQFGVQQLKKHLNFENITKPQAERIKTYIAQYEEIISNKNFEMKNTLVTTNYSFEGQTNVYHGKVRDVYSIGNDVLVMIATDRISAFDVILPQGIPYKGQVLNQIASRFLDATADIVPNWKMATPDPMVTVGLRCETYKVEMVIRGYLTGSAWREYKAGARTLCGIALPDGMKENQKFPTPIITPTTKADEGHDENISKEEIIAQGLVSKDEYEQLEKYTYALFQRGTEMAKQKGLILVDTKYEFGKKNGKIYLIDEIHTPDSSRYFYTDTYQKLFEEGGEQRQLSKEFVRKWLMDNGFQGKDGQQVPEMTEAYCNSVSERYIELYEIIVGEKFVKADVSDVPARIEQNVKDYLKKN